MTISSAEKTLEQDPIYSVQGHLIYEISPALWTAFDATYYTGGRTTIDGEKGERLENVRLGLTTSLSLSRHQSIKLFGSAGVYHRTENNFWAVGLAWHTAGVEGCSKTEEEDIPCVRPRSSDGS